MSVCVVHSPNHYSPLTHLVTFVQPSERYALRIHDMLVSYTQAGRKPKKVLGASFLPLSHFPSLLYIMAAVLIIAVLRFLVVVLCFIPSSSPLLTLPPSCTPGNWLNPSKPVESHLPLIAVTATGFDLEATSSSPSSSLGTSGTNETETRTQGKRQRQRCAQKEQGLEYRLEVTILPLRCYLDGAYVNFLRGFGGYLAEQHTLRLAREAALCERLDHQQEGGVGGDEGCSNSSSHSSGAMTSPLTYFQTWKVHPVELKINYAPNPLDLIALQGGDYMQLLNLLSIEALELSLTKESAV